MVVFDGWNYGAKELERLFEVAGSPKNIVRLYFIFYLFAQILLSQTKENITKAYRKKKEMDEAAELAEDDQKDIDNSIQKQKDLKEFFVKNVENNFYT